MARPMPLRCPGHNDYFVAKALLCHLLPHLCLGNPTMPCWGTCLVPKRAEAKSRPYVRGRRSRYLNGIVRRPLITHMILRLVRGDRKGLDLSQILFYRGVRRFSRLKEWQGKMKR